MEGDVAVSLELSSACNLESVDVYAMRDHNPMPLMIRRGAVRPTRWRLREKAIRTLREDLQLKRIHGKSRYRQREPCECCGV